ncbi:histidinol-phosphate transaminase [Roseibium sp.]|uniref:histidinol-phosphate transaminase n=1 Tax=Roseibium sp. TaxID=1936156 RepID=UPI003D0B0362
MSRFWSPIVENLAPYTPGEQPKDRVFIKLNTNENPYGPSPMALEAIRNGAEDDLRLYPDPSATDLRSAIASSFGVTADHIFVGNGSDEVLAHAFHGFFSGKAQVLFADVTYSFYKTFCELYALQKQLVPLNEAFELEPSDYRGTCGGIVIANPNAPTGVAIPLSGLEHILQQNPDTLVLVDEAYVDFGATSAVRLVPKYENLLVVQTFSKSRSLAGLRVGFAVGQPQLIQALRRIKDSFNSYPLGRLSLKGALAAWQDRDWFDETRLRVMADRDRLAERLKTLGFRVLPSSANFLFVSHERVSAAKLLADLRSEGILVRHFDQPRIENFLRISVGTCNDCDRLLAVTEDLVGQAG